MGSNKDKQPKDKNDKVTGATPSGPLIKPPPLEGSALPPELMLAAHLPVGVAVYWPLDDGADFEILYLNPVGARMLERAAEDLTGQRLSEAFPGAQAIGVLGALQEAHRSGCPQNLDSELYRDEGVELWVNNRLLRLETGTHRGALVAVFSDESDLVQLRRDSLEQRNRFRLVFENSLIGIFVVDNDRRIIEINDCACGIFGYDAQSLLGESVEILHLSPASFQRFGEEVFSKIESTGLVDVRYDLKRGSGEAFLAALSGRPLNGVDREAGVIWVVADISAMSRAEEALRASEERFALAASGANEGIWDWDIKTNRAYLSPRWKELIGYRDDEIPNRFEEWSSRVHPDDLSAANAAIEAHLRGETEMLETEFRMRCKDGSWRWILGRGLCVRDEQGRPLRMAGSHSDIDERRRAEDRARSQEAHLAAVLDTVQTGIVVIDHDEHLVVDANELAAQILGCPREELIGAPCGGRLCVNPQACPFAAETWHAALPITNQEAVFVRADGARVDVLKSSVPLRLDGRKLLIESFVDISSIKETEQALRRAKEEAESAAIAKSEFLAKMSHEIRTPMNSILGMTKLTLDTELDAEQRENLEIVDASAESLLALIDDILDFSKLEAHRVAMDPVDFDLSALFEEVLDGFAFRAAEKGLELIEFIDPQVPLGLCGDSQRLRQVLVNLVGNAIKFTAVGDIVVSVELVPDPKAQAAGQRATGSDDDASDRSQHLTGLGGAETGSSMTGTGGDGARNGMQPKWLRFTVRDTGVGVASDKQADIFLAFQQADNSVTRQFGGSGLGLSISRQLVELMGGRIGLESTPGKGSEFWFEVPLPPASSPVPSANLMVPDLKDLRCLVVDDNSANRRLLVKTLEGWGCRPRAVESGSQALAVLEDASATNEPYRMVLLDLLMPEMDGEQTARAIQQGRTCGDPDILLLASASVRGQASRLRALGVRSLLIKPVRQRQLLRAMSQALAGPNSAVDAAMASRNPKRISQTASFPGAQVLLVEDRLFNRKVALSYLARFGVEVTTAANGLHALELARQRAFDLILMDVQMPLLDGRKATMAIRDDPDNPNRDAPIVAMTAHVLDGDREKCMNAGMDDYLTKPIRLDQLERALAHWLNDAANRPPSAPAREERPATETFAWEPWRGESQDAERQPDREPDWQQDSEPDSQPEPSLPPELESLFEGDTDGLADLLGTFVHDAGADLENLMDAWRTRDPEQVRSNLHALKGLVGNMGYQALADRLARLEDAFRDADAIPSGATGLEKLIEQFQGDLSELIARLQMRLDGD
ncbi:MULTISPECIES: PAS domain S-box protein [Thiorhodovibrio]|uniref:PAS domain S-box protein n=1 Tax=Thiorhodovibrio TaxID=61593 RepID=UPI0019128160|nr:MULTISPECIES: PAS domain S-box protein [Thiorhodovibrio]MBK5967663.1 hypothetical protein [Thiorhodovibrio winogradskyi]WPL11611.1 Signal transduction histidine-protein kinase BarA [Thiorhodovibrio litoralis]